MKLRLLEVFDEMVVFADFMREYSSDEDEKQVVREVKKEVFSHLFTAFSYCSDFDKFALVGGFVDEIALVGGFR